MTTTLTPFWGFTALLQLNALIDSAVSAVKSAFATTSFNEAEDVEIPEDDSHLPRPTLEEIEARSKNVRQLLFGGEPDPGDDPNKGKEPDPDDDPNKGKEPGPDDDPNKGEEPDPDDEDEVDYEHDDLADGKKQKKEGEPDPDLDDPNLKPGERETIAVQLARENGRKAKDLERQLTERALEETRVKEELAEAKARLEEFEQVVVDPRSTPAYQELNEAFWGDIDAAVAEELPSAASRLPDFATGYMKAYLTATRKPVAERAVAIAELKTQIVSDLGEYAEPYQDLMDDDKVAADTLAREVVGVLRRNADRANQMIRLESELRANAKKGRLSIGVRDHERKVAELDPVLKSVGNMDEKLIEENPFHPAAVVAQLVKTNPAMKKKLEQAAADVQELITGPRPLTEKEYDTLEEQGVDIREYLKERDKALKAKREKLLPLIVRGLFATAFTNKALENIAKEQRTKKQTDDEMAALGELEASKGRRGKPVVTEPKKPVLPPHERPLAVTRYLNDGE